MAYIGAGVTRFNTADQLTVTGDATIDTTTLVVDSTNNNVGIGTSSLSNGLRTVIQGSQTGGAPATSGTTQTYGLLRLQGTTFTSALDMGTNGGNYAWIQSTDQSNLATNYNLALNPNGGNVGIGTTSLNKSSSSAALTVNTGTAANYSALELSSGDTLNWHINANDGNVYDVTAGTRNRIFYTNGTERMRLDSSGDVGIGTSSPSTYGGRLNITDGAVGGETTLVVANNNANQFIRMGINADVAQIAYDNADSLAFGIATDSTTSGLTTEHMRIDSSGNVGIGTSLPTTVIDARQTSTGGSTQIKVYNTDNSNTTTQTAALFLSPDSRANGALIFAEKENADFSTSAGRDISLVFSPVLNNTQTERMRIDSSGALNGPPSANFAIKTGSGTGDMQFFTNGTQRATIDSSGNVGIQNSSPAYTFEVHDVNVTGSGNEQGFAVNSSASLYSSTNNTSQFYINDSSSSAGTHNYFVFRHQGTTIGDVDTTDNTTIRYNTFVGAHWSQTTAANIIRGTIMSTIDEMMQWTDFEFTNEEGDVEKLAMAGHADYVIGQEYTIPCDDDGNTVTATAVGQTTDKRLAKVKVSDVASDRSVYGVFGGQYADGDISVESLGASFVRIGSGVTVTNGDLIESAGDGTGRVQADDIMRSCTVAKITSTIAKETFADGSKLYPCTLHCG